MKNNFYMVLPSNSSMSYFPDNKTTRFITRLPQHLNLYGEWGVSLTDIQIPMTFLHLPKHENPRIKKNYAVLISKSTKEENVERHRINVPHGVYHTVDDIIEILNKTQPLLHHLTFTLDKTGYVCIRRVCTNCVDTTHILYLAPTLNRILGFMDEEHNIPESEEGYVAPRPTSLISALPATMFVYTDICESYITGDVQTPLLRIIPLDIESYMYGVVKYKNFPAAKYIPLLHNSLQTIEIDIRDEFGQPIPFEHGTLTITLHLKKLD